MFRSFSKIVRLHTQARFRFIDFNEFLDIIIDQQGDERDIYDEISQGFKLFDTGTTPLKLYNKLMRFSFKNQCL